MVTVFAWAIAVGSAASCSSRDIRTDPDLLEEDAATDPALDSDGGAQSSCEPCVVTGPGRFCGLDVTIEPFAPGDHFGGFQSAEGNRPSSEIVVTFSAPVHWVSVQVLDPDFEGNSVGGYAADGRLIAKVAIPSDGTAGRLTTEGGAISGAGIGLVRLVPAPRDYVAYEDFMIVPAGCGAPTGL